VAVGLAMSAKRKGLDRVTVVSFGDGATNTGSFHEAANMAALWICRWSSCARTIFTPR
jgi:pyruvate dehydrogenase E1 component alpha subunit